MVGGAATAFIANEAPRPITARSRYAPIADEILHWARDKGGLENMMTPERLAQKVAGKVVAPGNGGTVWIGSVAMLMRFLSFWMPQWIMVSVAASSVPGCALMGHRIEPCVWAGWTSCLKRFVASDRRLGAAQCVDSALSE
jgi:hypothetical protein